MVGRYFGACFQAVLMPQLAGRRVVGCGYAMRLRPDLVELLTEEDFIEEVLANNHRYKPPYEQINRAKTATLWARNSARPSRLCPPVGRRGATTPLRRAS